MKTVHDRQSDFRFTGWHMLGVMMLFFGTIISVNLVMAWYATHSWSGLVVQNTYVVSQQFNAKAAAAKAMAATGITGKLDLDGRSIRYVLTHPETGPVAADEVAIRFRRPVGEHQDFTLTMNREGQGVFTAEHQILAGQWIVETTSRRDGEIIMHEAVRIHVRGERK
ncbi:FixH family protein [Rhizobiaceae bacterium n13]|uniref:FixH family protein n=1 Tax=Ferirhizobium litorale TaxID=2927786 RepID=A0AAE3QGM1_9HYPH|nr:FixH family protein [Fererhizobium litorale]MDI7863551.1 FixH family protein [Fererhizobium litorale]MDI7923528.1 FixH family protein [Fererhizobium litorale]